MPTPSPTEAHAPRVGRSLTLEITAVLLFKAAALTALYLAFFGPSHRIELTADRAAQILMAPHADRRQ
jgi:hypothetical protein